jgi:AraC-like DNA-binding protein/predicted nucleic acid-binding Zn finger protein
MYKYIQDSIKNNSRCVLKDLTRPQQKALSEVVRGLFTAGEPILRHIAQDKNKSAKKQAEKYSHHLGNVEIQKKIEELALKQAQKQIRKRTVIAYDLTDIAKESAKKIEKLSKVWDGSRKKVSTGFSLHGVGINGILTKFQIHDSDQYTTNQVRKKIITEISKKLNFKGIWVFDRGNDDKQFFKLLQDLKVDFIARLKENRQVVIKETGDIIKVKNLAQGKYRIYLMNKNNNKFDQSCEYTLIISSHLEGKEPIRLIHNLKYAYSKNQIVNMYLERWGVENLFKRVKEKFDLESIRVLKWQKFVNLVALVQLAVLVSTMTFLKIQQSTNALIIGVLMHYKKFMKLKTLGFNVDSFISFMKNSLKPLIIRLEKPPNQLNIFSKRQLAKLADI